MTRDTLESARTALARGDGRRLWAQIAAALQDDIAAGRYEAGAQVEGEHELARRFGVNRHTVRQALGHLASRGLVRVEHGRGTFVGDLAIEYALGRRTRFAANLAAAGLQGRHEVIGSYALAAPAEIAARLGVRGGTPLTVVETLGVANGRPISFGEHYVSAKRFPRMAERVARRGSISRAFADQGVGDFTRAASWVTTALPDERVAALLRQSAARPVLVVEGVNVDADEKPIEFGRASFAGDVVQLVVAPERAA